MSDPIADHLMSDIDIDLAEIRARAEAATEGPWVHLPPWKTVHPVGSGIVSPNGDIADRIEAEADAEFIAHAREDVPYLLDRLDRAEAALARVREVAAREAMPFPDGTPDREGEAVAAAIRAALTEETK